MRRAPVFVRLRDDEAAAEVSVPEPIAKAPNGPPADIGEDLSTAARSAVEQLSRKGERLSVEVGDHEIELTSLDKEFWPRSGRQPAIRKRDVAIYLATVAQWMLPHLRDRPITMIRCPNGIGGQRFVQRHWEPALPPFVETVPVYSEPDGADATYLLCNNLPTLLWLAQIACLEVHSWYSRARAEDDAAHLPTAAHGSAEALAGSVLNHPDFLVFDLDPSDKHVKGADPELHRAGFDRAREAATTLKELLDGLSVASFVKTSGRTGLHVFVPIVRNLVFEETHVLGKTLADRLARLRPDDVTIEWTVKRRGGRVLADYNQNARGKSLAAAYSPRTLPTAAVSMPLRWEELRTISPSDFTMLTAPERLAAVGDRWDGILDAKQDVRALLEARGA
jgi:bifunctional non-homologous end joining protein LigD